MSVDVRRLSDDLRRALRKRRGADLAPEDVDVALAALRAVAGVPGPPVGSHRDALYQIEMLDDHGWPVEVLASVVSGPIAQAAFSAPVDSRLGRRIRLRRGPQILADTATKRPPA
jgi:hypothetical protein